MARMKSASFRCLAALLYLAAASASHAAADWYQVEVLVFRHQVASDGGESWTDERMFADADPNAALDPRPVGRKAWRLTGAESALQRAAHYEPLLHRAWRQRARPRGRGRPVMLRNGAVSGAVTLTRGRYLHLALDLGLRASPVTTDAVDGLSPLMGRHFRLHESRRVRAGELHYFDHPRFGVLALVTPVEGGGTGKKEPGRSPVPDR